MKWHLSKNLIINGLNIKLKLEVILILIKKKDFIILPEIFAHLAEDLLIRKGINYAIFVQNGYVIQSTNNENKLFTDAEVYKLLPEFKPSFQFALSLLIQRLSLKI